MKTKNLAPLLLACGILVGLGANYTWLSQNIRLGAYYLSGDGDNEGVSVDSSGNATVSGDVTVAGGDLTFSGASSITGGAGNMTVTSGTGNSRTMTLQTTNSSGTATNSVVISGTQRVTISSSEAASDTSTPAGALVTTGGIYTSAKVSASSVSVWNSISGFRALSFGGNVGGGIVGFAMGSDAKAAWTSVSSGSADGGNGGNVDVALGRNAAGIVEVNSGTAGTFRDLRVRNIIVSTQTPATAGATGTAGMMAWDADYIYICTATNAWKRVAIATW